MKRFFHVLKRCASIVVLPFWLLKCYPLFRYLVAAVVFCIAAHWFLHPTITTVAVVGADRELVVEGRGFGGRTGVLRVTAHDGRTVEAPCTQWTKTSVAAALPEEAALRLSTTTFCDWRYAQRRSAQAVVDNRSGYYKAVVDKRSGYYKAVVDNRSGYYKGRPTHFCHLRRAPLQGFSCVESDDRAAPWADIGCPFGARNSRPWQFDAGPQSGNLRTRGRAGDCLVSLC